MTRSDEIQHNTQNKHDHPSGHENDDGEWVRWPFGWRWKWRHPGKDHHDEWRTDIWWD